MKKFFSKLTSMDFVPFAGVVVVLYFLGRKLVSNITSGTNPTMWNFLGQGTTGVFDTYHTSVAIEIGNMIVGPNIWTYADEIMAIVEKHDDKDLKKIAAAYFKKYNEHLTTTLRAQDEPVFGGTYYYADVINVLEARGVR